MALVQFAGLASGIDSKALIKAILDQQRNSRIKPLENKVSELQDSNSAFSELSDLLKKLKTTADKFRTLNGGALAKNASSSDESIAYGSATNSATTGSISISVSQLAETGTLSFDDRFASSSSAIYSGMNDLALEADRTISFDVGTGSNQESIDIVLNSSSTLDSIATQFNETSELATASVVNVGTSSTPAYTILIKSNDTGEELGNLAVTIGSAITDGGSGAFNSYTLNQASNAEFTLTGVTDPIERSSNTVSDLISGLTINLQSTGSATISVTNDVTSTTQLAEEFVNAYNAVIDYINENDSITVDSESNNIFAPLAKSSLDDSVLSALRQGLSNSFIDGNTVNILADLGITTNRSGKLDFDSEDFETALNSESSSVEQILARLGENYSAVGGTIDQFTRFNGLLDTTVNAQNSQITQYQTRISDLESDLSKQEEMLTARFSRLEALIGKLQSQQSSLGSILGSI